MAATHAGPQQSLANQPNLICDVQAQWGAGSQKEGEELPNVGSNFIPRHLCRSGCQVCSSQIKELSMAPARWGGRHHLHTGVRTVQG